MYVWNMLKYEIVLNVPISKQQFRKHDSLYKFVGFINRKRWINGNVTHQIHRYDRYFFNYWYGMCISGNGIILNELPIEFESWYKNNEMDPQWSM